MQTIHRAAHAAAARYRSVPASVLYPQLFLGFGWIRAAVAHGMALSWWSGDDLLQFLDETEELRLPVYEPFVEFIVRPLPILVSVVVAILQLLVGLALILNIRPIAWIIVGMFLNFNFIMAGEVNPSVFYVVMAMAVLLWIMLDRMTADRAYMIAKRATIVAAVAIVVCGPFITTLDPAHVIDDPSLIIITLSTLFALSCWLTYSELVGPAGTARPSSARRLSEPIRAGSLLIPTNGSTSPSSLNGGTGRPRGTGARRGAEASTSLETDLQELRAASPAEIMEAMDRPIPNLPTQGTMTYHEDVDSGFSIKDSVPDAAVEPPAEPEPGNQVNGVGEATAKASRLIASFEVTADPPTLKWYSVRCHFRVDESHYEERITMWQAVGFDEAIDLAEAEADNYADGEYLGSCDCFHLPDAAVHVSQGAEIYSLVRASNLDPDTYLRTFFFTGSERSAEV